MHSAPLDIREFTVVSSLPDRLRKDSESAWADLNLGGKVLDAFLEGPVCEADGNIHVTDIPFGRILRLAPGGDWSVAAEYDGWPNGMKVQPDGSFLITDQKRGLIAVDRSTQSVSVIAEGYRNEPFHGLNDLTIASNGDVYFTDQGQSGLDAPYGRVFRLSREGEMTLLMDAIPSPNGLVLSQDEQVLFLAVTRANAIWRLPLTPDRRVRKAGHFIQMSGGIGPDGLARPAGTNHLLAAHPGIGLWHFRENGLPQTAWLHAGFDYPTNLAADPQRPGSYFVTESLTASILRADLAGPGTGTEEDSC